jgi:hypothetical protein
MRAIPRSTRSRKRNSPGWLSASRCCGRSCGRGPGKGSHFARSRGTRCPLPPRHHRPCAGDPDPKKRDACLIGMAGRGPAMTWWGCNGVIPGRKRRKPLEGKGIHQNWIPFPVLWTAGDDTRCFSLPFGRGRSFNIVPRSHIRPGCLGMTPAPRAKPKGRAARLTPPAPPEASPAPTTAPRPRAAPSEAA